MAQHLCCSPSAVCDYPLHIRQVQSSSCKLIRLPGFLAYLPPPAPRIRLTPSSHAIRSHQVPVQAQRDGSAFESRSHVWINPKSPRASQLREQSYDSRYSSLLALARDLDSCLPTQEQVSQLLMGFRFGNNLALQDAVVILNNMTNPDTALLALRYFQDTLKLGSQVELYNVTMKLFRKHRDLNRAHHLFDEMLCRGIDPNNVTFSTLITCSVICNMPHKADQWFEKMTDFGCIPDDVTYSAMIDAYGKAGNVDKALALYDRARSERWFIDTVAFSTLISIYAKAGNFDGCLSVYEEMKALKFKPNLVIYNTLLNAMGRAKRPWQAKSIFKDMTANGIAPTWGTYTALLRALCRGSYAKDAIKLYHEMKDKALEFDVILYNTLLATCADAGFVDEAAQIFEEMKSSGTCTPDSWTFSSMITIYSSCGQVSEAERVFDEMVGAGFEPSIFVLTSLIQCYGKANRTDDVVRTFNQVLELGIAPDDRFCGCLLSVMTQTPEEELSKLVECVTKANQKLGDVINILLEGEKSEGQFRGIAFELFDAISVDVKKAYCNCLIDLCINLNLLDRACELLDLGLTSRIYSGIQSKTPTQWSLHVKSLSPGAALTALHIWMNDLMKAVEDGEELPAVLGINTGHGKHKLSEKGLAGVFEAHLNELNAPFHEAPDKAGWFLTTKDAAETWLESQNSPELASD